MIFNKKLTSAKIILHRGIYLMVNCKCD